MTAMKVAQSCTRGSCAHGPAMSAWLALALIPTVSLADVGAAKTFASGLHNPRGLAFAPNGALYVAEAGMGGPGPCLPSPSAPVLRCYGETGALAVIDAQGQVRRVARGLPSMALPNGTAEGGPVDVSFSGMAAQVVIGWGGNPEQREQAGPHGHLFGTLLQITPSGQHKLVADVAATEVTLNPDEGAIDSNPYGILAQPGRRIVADAGANALFEVAANRRVRTFAVPGEPGQQTVPTSVTEGPDGALYVGLLTGGPFFRAAARVLRISSDGQDITTFLSGLTAVVDVTFDTAGSLYALEIAKGFPTGTPPTPGLGQGRLVRKCANAATFEVLLDGLTFAAGVAIGPDGAVYLTNKSTSATAGEVLRLQPAACQ